jgi:hypothetical protein
MRWHHSLAYFFGGVFLANALPHLLNGVSGNAFQTPFASPPTVGLSSSMVNVGWGFFNLAVAWLLLARVGEFGLRRMRSAAPFAIGFLLMALYLAQRLGRLHGGL